MEQLKKIKQLSDKKGLTDKVKKSINQKLEAVKNNKIITK